MEAEFSDSGHHKLQVFLTNNPETGCSRTDEGDVITSPWGERTIKLRIDEEDEALVDALNTLYLPPRFTAIWHRDTKDLEVIYGPLTEDNETRSRSFDFDFGGISYSCEFGAASERLLLLVKSAALEEEGGFVDPRNLMMLQFYLRAQERQSVTSAFADLIPTSFWIRGFENWDENVVVDLVQHLNFYMRYFDRETPLIQIHENLPDNEGKGSNIRYPHDEFPKSVSAQLLDPVLLGLWESSVQGNPRLRFLYSYQIIEYAAFYHASEIVQQTVRRAVMSPHTHLDPTRAVTQILDAVANDRQHETEKMKNVVHQSIDPSLIWREVQPHADFFSEKIEFDGGVTLDALIMPHWSESDFATSWHPKFIDQVRKIRNALVHGREQRMANVIMPTRANDDRLRPWLAPLSVAAEQVILCRPS